MKQFGSIYELETGYTKIFVISGRKNILVDTGSKPLPDAVVGFMEQTGFSFGTDALRRQVQEGSYPGIKGLLEKEGLKIDVIICTHYHGDHVGNLKRLRDELQVPVALHPLDIPFVDGTQQVPAPYPIPEEIIQHLAVEHCGVDIQLQDGEFVDEDVQVIHVPGHTMGSICLLVKNRILITGDCMVGRNDMNPMMGQDELNLPVEMFSTDYGRAVKSLEKLLAYDFETLLPGHGTSLAGGGKEKLRALLNKRA